MHNNKINVDRYMYSYVCTVVMYDYIAYDYMLQAQLVAILNKNSLAVKMC